MGRPESSQLAAITAALERMDGGSAETHRQADRLLCAAVWTLYREERVPIEQVVRLEDAYLRVTGGGNDDR